MKKRISFFIIIVFLGLTSCKKNFLDTNPTDSVAANDIFKTTTNIWAALNGIHRAMYIQYSYLPFASTQDIGGIGSVYIFSDAMGEDVVMTSSGNGWFNGAYQWLDHRTATARQPYYNWYFFYYVIANANAIINNVDAAQGPDADKKALKGEALVYRAWAHFNLVQMFGKRYDAATANDQLGVPIALTSTTEGLPRSTVKQVYTQVIKDLDDAITNLTGFTRSNKSHFDVSVAKGIKARVALTMQDWATAAQLANEARQGYTLMSSEQYLSGFNNYTIPEWMWGSHQQDDQSTFFYSFFAYMSANFSSTNIRTNPKAINSNLYNQIPSTDVRKQLWDPTGASIPVPPGGSKFPYIGKKFLAASNANSVGDIPNMRAAEMYLIEAEARARLGQDATAQSVLYDLVKTRNGSYTKSTNTGTALINEILLQRRMELWGEGFRYFDLKRLNLPLDRTGANHNQSLARVLTIPAGDKQWEYLIPQDEMNANPNMVQNPL